MVRRSYTPEQIINKLREAEIHINQGILIGETSRKIGVTGQTYYPWRGEYGGMDVEQAMKLKSLEKENASLKKLVADLSLDNAILKKAAEGNLKARLRNASSSSVLRINSVFRRGGHVKYSGSLGGSNDLILWSKMNR